MMWGNENPTQMYMIDGDITKTLTNCATDPLYATRQEYARMLLFFLRHQPLEEIMKNIHGITSTLLMIAEDKTSSVRLHLADQIVGIILQVREHASPDLEYYLYDRLLQILLKYFQDDDYLVKAAASSAFNLLLDEGAIDKKMLIEGAYPTILSCTKNYDDEVEKGRTATAVALMGRIAPVLGGEALALFLDNYLEMCSRAAMSIRYPCAKIFPVMCQVLGTKITDERLLDAFVAMASSEEWEELRKICAENLALVALVCSPECRRDRLTRIVLKLAKDPSRNIVNATFKVLGQFIATFSTPKIISLAYTQEGELYITNPLHSDFSKHSDPKVVASYNDYINRADDSTTMQAQMPESSLSKSLSSLKVSSPTSTISSSPSFSSLSTTSSLKTIKYNNDSLSRKEILQIIKNNILEINKQMTESSFKVSDMDPSEYELEFMASNEEDENADRDSLNNYLTAQDMSSTSEVVQSSTYTAAEASSNSIDRENNSRNSEDENLQNNGTQSDVPGKKFRSSIPVIEHFWRKNTPADLSAIIKNAIVEAKKLPQQPLYEKRKLILPPPPTAAIDLPTPTSEEPSRSLAWDDFISNDHSKSKSTDRLNECQVDEANNLEPESNGTPESDDEAFNEYNSHKFWYITPDIKLDWDVVCDAHFDIPSRRAEFDPPKDYNQDIVPVEVLESYVTMVRNGEYAEARLTCAYDFPAVAFTIGKQNWHILRNLLQYLCDELDWKVRKTVASFIGVLAVILGREIASRDLVPIFIGLFKDLDEIKIKAIENFAKFLKFVDFSKHEEILPNIGKCLRIDSNTNWRIRESLAQQILIIIKWYDSINRHDYLLYLASVTCIFLQDKISCIREIGAEAMAEIIRIFNSTQRKAIIKYYLAKKFSLSYTWRKRQTFVNIFYKYIKANKNVMELVQMVLPDIKRLSYDAVPNIRLLVAKSLVELVNNDANILRSGDCEDVDIMKIIRRLQEDDDRDVRETAYMVELPGSGRKESVTMPTVTTTTSTTDLTNTPAPSELADELTTTDNERLQAASTNSTVPANNSETAEIIDDTNVVATCVDLNSSPVP